MEVITMVLLGLGALMLVILGVSLFSLFFMVEQQTDAVIERFGKFVRIAQPGLNLKIPFVEWVRGRVNMRVQQLDVKVETKTKDDVFVHVMVSVQYHVLKDKVYDAFYRLDEPENQITSYVFDTVRARVPEMKLDEVFARKDDIASAVKTELAEVMDDFGYGILKALVTDIDPDEKVKVAMNEINAAQRLRMAAQEKGEAEKILKVKAAEAEAESKHLQGQGIAKQRKAIIDGLRDSMEALKAAMTDDAVSDQDVMTLIMMTQYFDTMKDVAASSQTKTILMPHSPAGLADIQGQIRSSLVTAGEVNGNGR